MIHRGLVRGVGFGLIACLGALTGCAADPEGTITSESAPDALRHGPEPGRQHGAHPGDCREAGPTPPTEAELVALALSVAAFDDGRAPLTFAQNRQALGVVDALRAGESELGNARFAVLFESVASGGGALDVEAIVQMVLREAYLSSQEDLRLQLEKVRALNEQKRLLREQSARLVELRDVVQGEVARAAVEAEIKKWEEKLNGIGDDAQLANVDLQNILQKQQQTLQMMSNISKMLFDTAQSVIRKMGG